MANEPLLALLHLSDLSLPVGGYAHSYGMETYVQRGFIRDPETAQSFIAAMLGTTIRYTDAALLSLAHAAAGAGNTEDLHRLNRLCAAVKTPSETRAASEKMGSRLVKIFKQSKEAIVPDDYSDLHYPVAFGALAAIFEVPLRDALTGYLYNVVAGLVTNAVKLVPLGQHQGQEMLFDVQPLLADIVSNSLVPDAELIGISCAAFDIRCMQHETLYSRLFMS